MRTGTETETATPAKKSVKKVKKAPAKKKAVKAVKKAPAKKKKSGETTKKAPSYLERGLTAKEYQSEKTGKPIRWSDRRIAVVKALRKFKATNESTAKTADDIATKAAFDGLDAKRVKVHCDVYRGNELVAQGFVASCKGVMEGDGRQLRYYLTKKGLQTDFTAK